jgi:hypothetical protein
MDGRSAFDEAQVNRFATFRRECQITSARNGGGSPRFGDIAGHEAAVDGAIAEKSRVRILDGDEIRHRMRDSTDRPKAWKGWAHLGHGRLSLV